MPSKRKKNEAAAHEERGERKYSREAILAMPRFAKYQRDFLSALLTEEEYTEAEAAQIVTAYFNH